MWSTTTEANISKYKEHQYKEHKKSVCGGVEHHHGCKQQLYKTL
jgi:hypothetical protein